MKKTITSSNRSGVDEGQKNERGFPGSNGTGASAQNELTTDSKTSSTTVSDYGVRHGSGPSEVSIQTTQMSFLRRKSEVEHRRTQVYDRTEEGDGVEEH